MLPIRPGLPAVFSGSGSVHQSEAVLVANGQTHLIGLVIALLRRGNWDYSAAGGEKRRVLRCLEGRLRPVRPVKILSVISKKPDIDVVHFIVYFGRDLDN